MDKLDSRFSHRTDEIWAIVIIDIDHFKLVNDVFGHLEGDKIIRRVANILARNRRSTDSLLRYGGDEFVIVMPGTEQLKAVNQGERILQALAREVFPAGMEIGLSIGVAESRSADHHIADILMRADKALYVAKKGGRGRVSFYRDDSREKTEQNITFEHFVGRSNELAELRNVLNNTVNGNGNFVTISGEPGVGKTRLASELDHYSSFKNCLSLNTRCDELGADRPYIQITQPMDQYLSTQNKDDLIDFAEKLPSLLPQTAELFPSLNLQTAPLSATGKESVLKLRMYSEITLILKWIASRQTVIFTIDNLHWISEHDFDLFAYMARAAKDLTILFLTTMRASTEDFPEIEKKIKALACVVQYTSIRLTALDEEYTRHMVLFALRDPKIPGDILKRLVKQCSGNPLYLKELLLSLISSGAIEPVAGGGWEYQISDDTPLPDSISVLMRERVKDLNSSEKDVLCVGSMMPGGSFFLKPLAAVLEKTELELARTLEEPLRKGLIQEKLSESNSLKYNFIHDTMRTFLYQELSLGIRKTLQERFGLYYEDIYNQGDSTVLSMVAHHYCDSLNPQKARHFALLAAQKTKANGVFQDSLRWFKQYMLFADLSKEDKEEAYKARLGIGTLYSLFGNYDEAISALEAAAPLATNDTQIANVRLQEAQLYSKRSEFDRAFELYNTVINLVPSGQRRIQSHIQLAHFLNLQSSRNNGVEFLENILPEIQAIKEEHLRKALLADYYMTLGHIANHINTQQENTEICLKAVALYREISDKGGEAKALLNTAVTLRMTSKYEQRINILNDGLKILIEIGDIHSTLVAYINLGETYYSAREYSLARDFFNRCVVLVETSGFKAAAVWTNFYLGLLDKQESDFDNAEKHMRTAIDMAVELGLTNMAFTTRINHAEILINNEDFQQADAELTLLEADKELENMDISTIRKLHGIRGLERLKNPTIDKTEALKEAEVKLKAAMPDFEEEETTIKNIEILITLADCLHQQDKYEESQETFKKAETLLNHRVNSIDNIHYRQLLLKAEIFTTMKDLKKRIF